MKWIAALGALACLPWSAQGDADRESADVWGDAILEIVTADRREDCCIDLHTGTVRWTTETIDPPNKSWTWWTRSKNLWYCSGENAASMVVDRKTGKKLWSSSYRTYRQRACDPKSKMIVLLDEEELIAMSSSSGRIAWRVPLDNKGGRVCSAGAGRVIVQDSGRLLAFDTSYGHKLWETPWQQERSMGMVSVSEDAVIAYAPPQVEAWDAATGKARTLPSYKFFAMGNCASASNGTTHLFRATGNRGKESRLQVFSIDRADPIVELDIGDENSLRYSYSGDRLLVYVWAGQRGELRDYDLTTGAQVAAVAVPNDCDSYPRVVGSYCILQGENVMSCVDLRSHTLAWTHPIHKGTSSFVAKGRTVIAQSSTYTLRAWKLSTGAETWAITFLEAPKDVFDAGPVVAVHVGDTLEAYSTCSGQRWWTYKLPSSAIKVQLFYH